MMNCIPAYAKYIILSVMVGLFVILSIFYTHSTLQLGVAMFFAILQSRINCPKCGNPILKDKNGWYIFTMRTICRHCGQDTLLCEIEPDEVTAERLK
jgi:rRNA maturation protein Nop10